MPRNKPPTAVYLSNTHVDENAPGAVVGVLTAADKNLKHRKQGDVITYTVDDSRFEVVQHDGQSVLQLKSGVSLDYEASPTVLLKVTATDQGGLSKTVAFTLCVTDLPETYGVERVSVSSGGEQGNGDSINPSISGDGRFVAYESYASNLVADDTNNAADVFVFDQETQTTVRVSVNSSGAQGNSDSGQPSVSADGRFVAYQGWASNLVEGDTNGAVDVFVYDSQTQTTERISVSSSGEEGNGSSINAAISADGRYVTFTSAASNLVSGDSNGTDDVFVYDRQTHTTEQVSPNFSYNLSTSDPVISADGRYVAFELNYFATIFVYDRETGTTESTLSGDDDNGGPREPSISADGRYVAGSNATGGPGSGSTAVFRHIYVYDRNTGTTARVSKKL